MNSKQYKQLDVLLGELNKEIGHNRICIIPYHICECAYIGVYKEDGSIIKQANGFDLQECVNKLKIK